MRHRPFSARCSSGARGGFTLSEVLVALSMASLVIFGVGSGFVFVTKAWTEHQGRTQVQQSNRMTVEAVSRELRIAGACGVPSTSPAPTNNFQAIAGTHVPLADTITITSNPLCAGPTGLGADCNAPCTAISVSNTTNFVAGTWAYIENTDPGSGGPYGEYFLIQSVTAGAPGTVNVDPVRPLAQSYPQNDVSTPLLNASTVYGADQRLFKIDSTCTGCNGIPTLTVTRLDGIEQPLVKGVDQMAIQYVVNRTYAAATCDGQTGGTLSLCMVNLPGSGVSPAGDWWIVRALSFAIDSRSTIPVRASGSADGYLHRTETFIISPRNFIFPSGAPRLNWTPY